MLAARSGNSGLMGWLSCFCSVLLAANRRCC